MTFSATALHLQFLLIEHALLGFFLSLCGPFCGLAKQLLGRDLHRRRVLVLDLRCWQAVRVHSRNSVRNA